MRRHAAVCPGSLLGRVEHQCALTQGRRATTTEPILAPGPSARRPASGPERRYSAQAGPSPDTDQVLLSPPSLKRFILDDEGWRSASRSEEGGPLGGGGDGDCVPGVPVKKALRPVQVTDQGKIKRIRGVALGPSE